MPAVNMLLELWVMQWTIVHMKLTIIQSFSLAYEQDWKLGMELLVFEITIVSGKE